MSCPTVLGWRDRYQIKGIDGLADEARSGRPRQIDCAAVLAPPPTRLGVTPWSTRLPARHLKISEHSVVVI